MATENLRENRSGANVIPTGCRRGPSESDRWMGVISTGPAGVVSAALASQLGRGVRHGQRM